MFSDLSSETKAILIIALILIIQMYLQHKDAKKTCSPEKKSLSHGDSVSDLDELNYVRIVECGQEDHGEGTLVLYVSEGCTWCLKLINELVRGGHAQGHEGTRELQVVYLGHGCTPKRPVGGVPLLFSEGTPDKKYDRTSQGMHDRVL